MTLEFERVGPWAERSTCGRYTVAAARVNDKFNFCGYHIEPGKPGQVIACFSDAEKARQCCRDHALTLAIPETTFSQVAQGEG